METLPNDVIRVCILRSLSPASLVSCSLTSSKLHKLTSLRIKSLKKFDVLESIFADGSVEVLKWFAQHLNFSIASLNEALMIDCLRTAAKGTAF